jgi:translation initiation factor eIF-2B subunit delta
MKSAIRFLKYEISILSIDITDGDAKASLGEGIDYYIMKKIIEADQVIVSNTVNNIHDGDVILTHGRSSVCLFS